MVVRRSKIEPFADLVLKLDADGRPMREIAKRLEQAGVRISDNGVYQWLRRNADRRYGSAAPSAGAATSGPRLRRELTKRTEAAEPVDLSALSMGAMAGALERLLEIACDPTVNAAHQIKAAEAAGQLSLFAGRAARTQDMKQAADGGDNGRAIDAERDEGGEAGERVGRGAPADGDAPSSDPNAGLAGVD